MKAAIHHGKKSIILTDIPTPKAGEHEYLVKIKACAICGSDTWWLNDAGDGEGVHGHEAAGEIVAVGPGATRFKVGDRVVCYAIKGCGKCHYCQAGEPTHCTGAKSFVEGGFQEFSVYHESLLFPCPPEADWVTASLLSDAIGVPLRGLRKVPEAARQGTVTIWGLGPLGLLQVMFLKAAGARQIIGIDTEPARLAKAKELGASLTINPKEQDTVKAIMAATGNIGADSAFVYVRHPQVTVDAVNSTRYDNPICTFVGLEGKYEMQEWYERTMIWSFYFLPSEYRQNLEFIQQHKIDLKKTVSDVFPLEKINEAFIRRFEQQDESLKIVITMD